MGDYGFYLDGVDKYRIIDVGVVPGLVMPPELVFPGPIHYPHLKEQITTLFHEHLRHLAFRKETLNCKNRNGRDLNLCVLKNVNGGEWRKYFVFYKVMKLTDFNCMIQITQIEKATDDVQCCNEIRG